MDDDLIEYFFDDIGSFYAELDEVLHRPDSTEQDVQRITTQYINFLVRYQDEFVKSSIEFAQVAYKLFNSQLYLENSTIVLGHILNQHALVSQDMTELLISYSLLLYAGKDEQSWMQYILAQSIQNGSNTLFCKIMREVKFDFYTSCDRMLSVSFALCFEMCKLAKLEVKDLDILDTAMVNYFLDLVEETRGDAQEVFNYDIIRLIMVLNEQYMMSGLNDNLILTVLSKRIGISDIFSTNLIFMLNRSNDTCIQMLILKLLYGIFTTESLYEYFYTNDLHVLLDITLRELCDLGDTKESQTLRDAYLRVLEPLLENTQLRIRPYKKDETCKILRSLLNPMMGRKVNPTTKRLVDRIIDDWWSKLNIPFYQDHGSSPNLLHTSALSSTSSNNNSGSHEIAATNISSSSIPATVDETSTFVPRKKVEQLVAGV